MAERRRVTLLALAQRDRHDMPCEDAHALAHKISEAGDYLPVPVDEHPDEPDQWSVFGERRLIREVPTFMESKESPFTALGRRHMAEMEMWLECHGPFDSVVEDLLKRVGAQEEIITELRAELADSPEKIEQLSELVDLLRRQLSGIID